MGTPAGWKNFTSAMLSATEVNDYLMNQTVMVFASAAARTSGLGTPNEGNLTYLKDSNSFWYYDGSSWLNMGNVMVFANSTARSTAIPSPTEGMLTWLGDVDELEVYNGTSWLRLVVTSDDEGLTVAGNISANTGKFVANRASATGGSSAGGIDLMIDGNTYGQIFMSNSNTMRFTSSANSFDGSASITSDLTVDTSSLKVSASSDVVGIMTASPSTGQYNDWSVDIASGRVRIGGVRSGGSAGIALGSGTPDASWYSGTAFMGLDNTSNSSDVGFWHSGAWRMQITNGGITKIPYQPAAYAFNNYGSYTLTDNQTFAFNGVVVNRGGHYNGSTSTFTCPVAGAYFVQARILTQYNGSPSDMRIAVNGNRIDSYSGYSLVNGVLSSHKQGHVHGIVSCSAGDALTIKSVGYCDFYGSSSAGHSAFSVHFLG